MSLWEILQLSVSIVTPAGVVGWFFMKRGISALDKVGEQLIRVGERLEDHGTKMVEFSGKLERLSDTVTHAVKQTNAEIDALKNVTRKSEDEILSLRESRHSHANTIMTVSLKNEVLERDVRPRLEKMDKLIAALTEDVRVLFERDHDILTAVSNLWSIARADHRWDIPEYPPVRKRSEII